MNNSDFANLIEYNNWANRRILTVVGKLSPEQLADPTGLATSSAFQALRHVLDAQWSWRMACEGKAATKLLWELEPLENLQAVRAYWRGDGAALLAFVQGLSDADLARAITPGWSRTKQYQIKNVLLHICNHGTNHRSEVAAYCTRLGYSAGDIEFLQFMSRKK